MNRLLAYLNANGILLCNTNPYLPSLEDIGCSWQDVTELIDNYQLFYSKVFKKRTTYLSAEAYYLLKSVKKQKALPEPASRIYSILDGNPIADTAFLKQVSLLPAKEYKEGFDFLLQNMYITALKNGTQLNENWSTIYYGTSAEWERLSPNVYECGDPKSRLWDILSGTMTEKQFAAFIR